MWDNYNDSVTFNKKIDVDSFKKPVYSETEQKLVRYVKGYDSYDIDSKVTTSVFKRVYEAPFEIKEGDKIDNRLVKEAKPVNHMFGGVAFYQAVVV